MLTVGLKICRSAGVLGISDPAKAGFLHSLSFTEGGMLQTVFVIAFMLLAPAFGTHALSAAWYAWFVCLGNDGNSLP
jgi:hypothetical protein